MLLSSMPVKFGIAFGSSAGGGFIQNPLPVGSQIGIAAGRASFTDGFPPLTFTPILSGGDPPWGADMNGILYMISSWDRWVAAGGPATYDSTFSSTVGGYPKGALLQVAATSDRYWLSTVDNNNSNPDSGGANWVAFPDLIVQQQFANYTATDTGTQNHPQIALTVNTAVANLIGAPIRFIINFSNTITNPDIKINGSTAITMKNADGSAIVVGQFPNAGTLVTGHLVSTSDFRVTAPGKPVTSPPPANPFVPGMIFLWGAEVPPSGALECDGSLQLISTYPNLFAVISNRFGGNGTTNFRLPDLRGAFVRGWDHGRGLDIGAGTRTVNPDGTGGAVGDHVGGWEQPSINTLDITGHNPSTGLAGSGTSPGVDVKLYNARAHSSDLWSQIGGALAPYYDDGTTTPPMAANMAPWEYNLSLGSLQAPDGAGASTSRGYNFSQFNLNGPLSPPQFNSPVYIRGNLVFQNNGGGETRPLNIALMYVITF